MSKKLRLYTKDSIACLVKDVISYMCVGYIDTEFSSETRFYEDLGADSLDCVEMVMEIEKRLNISIPDEDIDGMNTVGELVSYLDTKLNGPKTKKLLEYK